MVSAAWNAIIYEFATVGTLFTRFFLVERNYDHGGVAVNPSDTVKTVV
jgi:hypothetical protein